MFANSAIVVFGALRVLMGLAKGLTFLHVDRVDSDRTVTGWMPRLIWVFANSWICLIATHNKSHPLLGKQSLRYLSFEHIS